MGIRVTLEVGAQRQKASTNGHLSRLNQTVLTVRARLCDPLWENQSLVIFFQKLHSHDGSVYSSLMATVSATLLGDVLLSYKRSLIPKLSRKHMDNNFE